MEGNIVNIFYKLGPILIKISSNIGNSTLLDLTVVVLCRIVQQHSQLCLVIVEVIVIYID